MNLEYGSWTPFEFENWTECSATCDQGYQFRGRSRICTLSVDNNKSNICRGSGYENEKRVCNTHPCPSGMKVCYFTFIVHCVLLQPPHL